MAIHPLHWRYDRSQNLYAKQIDKSELDKGSLSVTQPSKAGEPPRNIEFYLAVKMLQRGESQIVTGSKNVDLFKISGGGEYDDHERNYAHLYRPHGPWGTHLYVLHGPLDMHLHESPRYWDDFDSYQLSAKGAFLVGAVGRRKAHISIQELDAIRAIFEQHLGDFTKGATLRERFGQRRRDRVLELIMSDLREYYEMAKLFLMPPTAVRN